MNENNYVFTFQFKLDGGDKNNQISLYFRFRQKQCIFFVQKNIAYNIQVGLRMHYQTQKLQESKKSRKF